MRRLFNTTTTYSWDVRRPRGRLQADAGYRIIESVLWCPSEMDQKLERPS